MKEQFPNNSQELTNCSEVNNIIRSFILIDNPKETDEFVRCINNGDIPIIVSNHRSLSDVFGPYQLINSINLRIDKEVLKGFYLPVAASLTTGDQNEHVTEIYPEIIKHCQSKGIELIELLRVKDIEIYNIDQESEKAKQWRRNGFKIVCLRENKFGLILFPEGTTQAGRLNPETNKCYGHHSLESNNIADSIIQRLLRQEAGFIVLPLIINGSEKVFSPDTYKSDISQIATVEVGHVLKPNDFNPNDQPTYMVMNDIFSRVH